MIYAKPFDWRTTDPVDISDLLDAFVAHPEFLAYPYPSDIARMIGANLLADENNLIWASYDTKKLTGVVIFTQVVPRVDALMHFLFLDQNLAGKRKLLRGILDYYFRDLGFRRVSMEVPDRKGRKHEQTRLERFARKALGFRLEGEIRDRHPDLPKSLTNDWVARQGSRREQAYYDGSAWSDIVLLRVLASEWITGTGSGGITGGGPDCQSDQLQESLPPSSGPPPVASSEVADPVTPSPSSPETSSPSDKATSDS